MGEGLDSIIFISIAFGGTISNKINVKYICC
ncbi:MAG: hypothetical protein HUJ68_00380 [Clostridia bacterium]|nr:hypothetical protein [Clostridia bacterium]